MPIDLTDNLDLRDAIHGILRHTDPANFETVEELRQYLDRRIAAAVAKHAAVKSRVRERVAA